MDPSILQRIAILEQQIAYLTRNKSKKRVSGYSLFCSTMRDDAKVTVFSNSNSTHQHVNRELASMWKSLSYEEQLLWNTHATLR